MEGRGAEWGRMMGGRKEMTLALWLTVPGLSKGNLDSVKSLESEGQREREKKILSIYLFASEWLFSLSNFK